MTKFDRPFSLDGHSFHIPSGCGMIHITVNFTNKQPVEVYARSSAKGGCVANTELIGRLISIHLQAAQTVPLDKDVKQKWIESTIENIVDQCTTVKCAHAMGCKDKIKFIIAGDEKPTYIKSCGDAIGQAILRAMQIESEAKPEEKKQK